MKILRNMGLLSNLFKGTTVVLLVLVGIMYIRASSLKKDVETLKEDLVIEKLKVEKLDAKLIKTEEDYANTVRELQSVVAQLHNKNKSLEKENILLRRGVRLDLLTVRVRRNGKTIDSTYQQAYKYLNK